MGVQLLLKSRKLPHLVKKRRNLIKRREGQVIAVMKMTSMMSIKIKAMCLMIQGALRIKHTCIRYVVILMLLK
jgi:hypothetical protein